jgi:hypothetical protein
MNPEVMPNELLDSEEEWEELMSQRPGVAEPSPGRYVSELAEANCRPFGEELAIQREGAAMTAGHAHDSETYVPTGRPSGARPSGSQSVADAGVWFAEQSGWSLAHLRAVVNVRGRSPAQVENRMKLAQVLATARSEQLFTASALAGALGCAKRTVERLVSLVTPPDVPDVDFVDQAAWEEPFNGGRARTANHELVS